MDSSKDFKAVKVQMKQSQKSGETLSRSMLYSGINIFGQLSQLYLQNKESGGSYSAFSSQIKPSGLSEGDGSSSMMSLSQEVLAIFKRLQKKDSTTKIKAFAELDNYLAEQVDISQGTGETENDVLQNLLTFFLYHFCRIIMNEPDKKVREAAYNTFQGFIKKAKRRLGPHIKKIFSLWYCSFFDVSQEVANLAKKNFELAFPENKRDQVFKLAFKNFLNFANEQLRQSEDSLSESTVDLSKAQREDVFDRITSSVLLALASSFGFIQSWTEEEKNHFKKKLMDVLDLNVKIVEKQDKLIEQASKKGDKKQQNSSYLWSFLQSNYRGRVRSSCLLFISNLLLNIPSEVIQFHISQLSPLVYKLVGEDNSSLQTTLWREALFTLGKNYPQSWETINIKKDFLPKLYLALKNAGYGAPVALYENFIKFASIFPFYHLVDYTEDKQNKASFKERCNLIREAFTTLYQGLKNDEAVAFHQDLTKCYYDTLVFLVWKRVQPLILKPDGVSQEDKDFAIDQLKKVIQVPVEDYINNYEKFQSRVQIQRNIRHTIPSYQARCFRDMAERSVDERIYTAMIQYIYESTVLGLDKPNSMKILSAMLKQENQKHPYFHQHILGPLIIRVTEELINQIVQDTENLNKDTIDKTIKKCQNLVRVIYKMNKFSVQLNDQRLNDKKIYEILTSVHKKEAMAKNVLTSDLLAKFSVIKDTLIKSLILTSNLQESSVLSALIEDVLNNMALDNKVRNQVLVPELEFKKINFGSYYEQVKKASHAIVQNFLLTKVVLDNSKISQNFNLVDTGISRLLNKQGSFIDENDLTDLTKEILAKIKSLGNDVQSLSYYFQAIKQLVQNPNNHDEFKHLLFDKLLTIRSKHQSYNQLWAMFEQSLKNHMNTKDSDFFKYCLTKLKDALKSIIHNNSNFDIDTFNRFTYIVKAFVDLCQDKQTIIEQILLQEDNFSNLEHNSLPLKMFRDLFLSGGIAFDVTKLFTKEKEYVWLVCVLLNVRHLPSLANFIQLKKQLMIFVDTEVIPVLINLAQTGSQDFVLEVFKWLGEECKTRIDYVYTLEHLVKKMIDPGDDFPAEEKPLLKVDEFKQIFRLVNKDTIRQYLEGQNLEYNLEVETFIRVLKQLSYFIIDESETQELFNYSFKQVYSLISSQTKYGSQAALSLEVYQCLLEYYKKEEDSVKSIELLITLLKNPQQVSDDSNFLNASLQFIAYMMNTLGVGKFNESVLQKVQFQAFINKMIEVQAERKLSPLTYIYLMSIIRKTIGSDLITNKPSLIHQVIEIAKEHSLAFELKIQKIQESLNSDEEAKMPSDRDESLVEGDEQIENFEYEMLQDIAETLLVFPIYINQSLNENDLYILISTGIESLQKAAFVLLKFLYENFIPEINYEFEDAEIVKSLMQEQEEAEKIQKEQETMDEEEKKQQEVKKLKYKNKLAFKNISEIMVEILETPPNIHQQEEESKQIMAGGSDKIESIIFGESKDGCMNQKVFGYFLAWNALLIKIENGRIKSQLHQLESYGTVLGALNEYLEENYDVYQMLLVSLIAFLPDFKRGLQGAFNVGTFEPEYIDLTDQKQSVLFAVYTLVNFMKSFPSLARKYYQECEKQLLDIVIPYIKQVVSPAILENEIKKIEVAQLQLNQSELSFALFKSTKEILANYKKGEIEMTLKIKLPNEYPLKLVEVEVSKQLKISEKQMRKWILGIRKTLQFQNGDIISAVLLWKNNIEKEIEGVEDCYICYCVVHEQDQSLPKMPCKTCKNKFHVACIRKWFRTSHKSNCPICQNYFF